MDDTIRKRSVVVAGHRTSVSLESAFWTELKAIAAERRQSINELVESVDKGRAGNLSSALRLFVLAELRRKLAPDGAAAAEHADGSVQATSTTASAT
ncbi:MAG: ribbon-helix-helix domain-containing protein [Alphaproteobacteria bacterium]|nr:ribbon-helix-helix domain-containing protein [Alphaproteobacteria bacterium]